MVLSNLDRALLDRCLARMDGAWEEFVDRFLPLVVHVVNQTGARRMGKLPDDWRDDLVAEVMLTLVDDNFNVLRKFQGRSSLPTYLVVVARRVAARKLAGMRQADGGGTVHPKPSGNGQSMQRPSGNGSHQAPTAPEPTVHDDGPEHIERTEHVESLIDRLPPREAKAIRLYHFEHWSYAEISSHLRIPKNSVGPLLSRARGHLRDLDDGDHRA